MITHRGLFHKLFVTAFILPVLALAAHAEDPAFLNGIPTKEYQERRSKIQEKLNDDELLLLKGYENKFGAQEDDFYYLTGSIHKKGYLLISSEKSSFYVPEPTTEEKRWNHSMPAPNKKTAEKYGFKTIRPVKELPEDLANTPEEKNPSVIYLNTRPEDYPVTNEIQNAGDLTSSRSLTRGMRLVKSPAELIQLKQATDITRSSHRQAFRNAEPGAGEWMIESVIERVFFMNGAEGTAFGSIVGSGPNSTILHYMENSRRMKKNETLVMDIGAMYNHYSADVTRTIPVDGSFTERQKELYKIVHKALKEALKKVKPGNTMMDVHRAASSVIADKGYRQYFTHATSHWLGLNVHDPGAKMAKLKPGMVLTVEPGIYIEKEDLGIRIEDDVVVSQDGYVNLTDELPKSVKDVEELMSEKGSGQEEDMAVPPSEDHSWINKIYPEWKGNGTTDQKNDNDREDAGKDSESEKNPW